MTTPIIEDPVDPVINDPDESEPEPQPEPQPHM